ncbi:MAG: pyruvate dehydrogenase (acetyl-transferring), homodimeric type [Gammaproteobacteria bacterium]|jgi:pyruvate dehydrogenase E1 component
MAVDQLINDNDTLQTEEWLEALQEVIEREGVERAQFLLTQLQEQASKQGITLGEGFNTPYVNTIPVEQQPHYPGNKTLERRLEALIRWNAIVMVLRAGYTSAELGGHIASYASAAHLYEVGFNHFFHAKSANHGGDLIYYQGHSSPGIYARSYLEGRLTDDQLDHFRQEVEVDGLSSYPHPWLMPHYWQFPTVSMGLGPLQAIYQARFMKYLQARELAETQNRKVWCFCGDGEMDEPESLGALSVAGREKLDNLIFVINCNLQRLDGPVRGNGKIIQEFESVFRGAGWHVIKVIWGSDWDPLLAKDTNGALRKRMMEVVDGDYQAYKARGGAYAREHFFGKSPELKAMVEHLNDDQIYKLNRGGHDNEKVFAAYQSAVNYKNKPVVILAKTVKGFGMGAAGEALNYSHQAKKMDIEALKEFRTRFHIPISDEEIISHPYYKFEENSEEMRYLHARREALGGYLPARSVPKLPFVVPGLNAFETLLKATGERHISTTMAFVRILNILLKDEALTKYIVPIIPDEARTFGMEGLFRTLGIYNSKGQLYEPVDAGQVMYYREDKQGQLLEEGINEGGAFCSWIAAATAYSTHERPMIPFYIFYSMFGFQRVGDLAWAAGDSQARGFLLGATAGRTTLAGEGLQHQDGHSLILASTIPNCVSYDPTFAYELAVIIQNGMQRMFANEENVFYYITVMNENYEHPAMPENSAEGIIKGMYCLRSSSPSEHHVQLLGSGTILLEVIKAAEVLKNEYQITSDIWSVTSFNELQRNGASALHYNRLHPEQAPQIPYVTQCLGGRKGPVIAATDYMRAYSEQIRAYIPNHYVTLGTDGFGRSDTRERLRYFFEVNSDFIVIATLKALADRGQIPASLVAQAIQKFNINPNKPEPARE